MQLDRGALLSERRKGATSVEKIFIGPLYLTDNAYDCNMIGFYFVILVLVYALVHIHNVFIDEI